MLTAYELQVFAASKWRIEAIFDDPKLAVLEAQRVRDSRNPVGVRVVQESFDQRTNETTQRVVFRFAAMDRSNAEVLQQRKANDTRLGATGDAAAFASGQSPKDDHATVATTAKTQSSTLKAMVALFVIAATAAVALVLIKIV
ncbi:MAG: hypothetical protein ACTS3R_08805 [Inquilinaceae bacterium]